MSNSKLYPLSKTIISDLVATIISLNDAGQTAYPKHYFGLNKTSKERAEKAVQSLLKFQMMVFDKLYSVNVNGEVQNIIFEKSPAGLFSNRFLEMLVYDLECTTVTKDEFMAFVDKDSAAVKRDAAFVRDFLPKYNIFFEDAQYDNTTILTRVQSENAQHNQSASVGAEAYAGVSWLGLIGAKDSTKANLETANSTGTQTAATENISPYLSASERTTIMTLASAYMLDKIHNIQHQEWPEMDTMAAVQSAKLFTDKLNHVANPITLKEVYRDADMLRTFNALQVSNDYIQSFVSSLVKYGQMETLKESKGKPKAVAMRDGLFWLNLNKKIENNGSNLMEDEIRYILKYQNENPLLRLLAGAINAYSMTDTALADFKKAIIACQIPESSISTDIITAVNPNFTYCPELLSVKTGNYFCEPYNLVFFNNPYNVAKKEDSNDDDPSFTGFIHIDRLGDLFPDTAKSVNFSSDNPESSASFVDAVNLAVTTICLENEADFVIALQPVPSEVGCGGIIAAHRIQASYVDSAGSTLPLTPEGLAYSGDSRATELKYPIADLYQQKKYLEKLSGETRIKEAFRRGVLENGVASVEELLKKRIDNPAPSITKSNGTVTP
jgi:hypothetical protein